ncbi:MAG: hypothetical protein K5647_04300 [Clostridiales bacterium]|nr:hypothetical protein [Clostridiales bacterium]
MTSSDQLSEQKKKRKGFIAGTIAAWLVIPALLLPLIISLSEKNPDDNSWRLAAMVVFTGVFILSFSVSLLFSARKLNYSVKSLIPLLIACILLFSITIIGTVKMVSLLLL